MHTLSLTSSCIVRLIFHSLADSSWSAMSRARWVEAKVKMRYGRLHALPLSVRATMANATATSSSHAPPPSTLTLATPLMVYLPLSLERIPAYHGFHRQS